MIGRFMKRKVYSVSPSTTVREAAQLVVEKHIGTLPVVDAQGVLVGLVTLEDMLRVFLPGFATLLEDVDFVHDFGALEAMEPEDVPAARRMTMRELMRPPVAVEETSSLMRAFTVIVKHDLTDLPVVDEKDRLVGIASRADIAIAFLKKWDDLEPVR